MSPVHRRHLHACGKVLLGRRAAEGYTDAGMSESRGWKGRGQEARLGGLGQSLAGAPDGQDTCRTQAQLGLQKAGQLPGRPSSHPGREGARGKQGVVISSSGNFSLKKKKKKTFIKT